MGTRYIEIPAERLNAELRDIGKGIERAGGAFRRGSQHDEIVYTFDLPASAVQIKVYTSLAAGESSVRGCGEDAVRLVLGAVGTDGSFRPLAKSQKILRTAPKGDEATRVEAFCARLRDALRELYARGRAIPACPKCQGLMAERKGTQGPFWGCRSFPECRGTRPRKQEAA